MGIDMEIKIPSTLEITNPRWCKKFKDRQSWEDVNEPCMIDGKRLSIANFRCCVVGEALNLFDNDDTFFHGTDDEITYHRGCKKCSELSHQICSDVEDLSYYSSSNQSELEETLQEFATHLEEVHPEYIEEAKERNKKA